MRVLQRGVTTVIRRARARVVEVTSVRGCGIIFLTMDVSPFKSKVLETKRPEGAGQPVRIQVMRHAIIPRARKAGIEPLVELRKIECPVPQAFIDRSGKEHLEAVLEAL